MPNRVRSTPPNGICTLGPQAYFLLSQGGYSDEGGQETRSGYYSEGSDEMGGSAGSAGMGDAAGAATATAAAAAAATAAEQEEEEEFDDEAFARRLQEEEQRAVMSRLIAAQLGMAGGYSGEEEEQADGEEALEDDTDPDQMTYEQLTALGEVVGTEQVGVSRSTLAALAEVTFVQTADAGEEQCVAFPHHTKASVISTQLLPQKPST